MAQAERGLAKFLWPAKSQAERDQALDRLCRPKTPVPAAWCLPERSPTASTGPLRGAALPPKPCHPLTLFAHSHCCTKREQTCT